MGTAVNLPIEIIFVDVDGVLNNPKSLADGNRPDPDCIAVLNWILAQSGAQLVVSSSWRGRPNLAQIFKSWGISAPIFSRTPFLSQEWYPNNGGRERAQRGYEIQQWLNQTLYPVKSFVILDDDHDMEPFTSHLVETDPLVGLTCADGQKALDILNEPLRLYPVGGETGSGD